MNPGKWINHNNETATCQWCGETFIKKRPKSRYCSTRHSNRDSQVRHEARKKDEQEKEMKAKIEQMKLNRKNYL